MPESGCQWFSNHRLVFLPSRKDVENVAYHIVILLLGKQESSVYGIYRER